MKFIIFKLLLIELFLNIAILNTHATTENYFWFLYGYQKTFPSQNVAGDIYSLKLLSKKLQSTDLQFSYFLDPEAFKDHDTQSHDKNYTVGIYNNKIKSNIDVQIPKKLYGGTAEYNEVLTNIRSTLSQDSSNKTLIYYFLGHSFYDEETKSPTLTLIENGNNHSRLSAKEIEKIAKSSNHQNQIIFIFDTCFSSGFFSFLNLESDSFPHACGVAATYKYNMMMGDSHGSFISNNLIPKDLSKPFIGNLKKIVNETYQYPDKFSGILKNGVQFSSEVALQNYFDSQINEFNDFTPREESSKKVTKESKSSLLKEFSSYIESKLVLSKKACQKVIQKNNKTLFAKTVTDLSLLDRGPFEQDFKILNNFYELTQTSKVNVDEKLVRKIIPTMKKCFKKIKHGEKIENEAFLSFAKIKIDISKKIIHEVINTINTQLTSIIFKISQNNSPTLLTSRKELLTFFSQFSNDRQIVLIIAYLFKKVNEDPSAGQFLAKILKQQKDIFKIEQTKKIYSTCYSYIENLKSFLAFQFILSNGKQTEITNLKSLLRCENWHL